MPRAATININNNNNNNNHSSIHKVSEKEDDEPSQQNRQNSRDRSTKEKTPFLSRPGNDDALALRTG